ncbi:L-aspartate oxidase [Pustulibacterium marinum]|uniref:L-aspartate oxidase n=1 Tax=Pustulibacterium marinum TaxID=1224947 RepID=A0A1I7F0E0_9FLAO|nr:L-aspartate oxidase [Pustulibacterium marinum]SFU29627.1 L-aspartate oxidase [Pustulibacterium marinum]
MQHIDFLIIGSGIAGLTYALKTATQFPDKNIVIFTKSNEDESNTKYAQGGIASVLDLKNDSFEKHISDTLIAGDGFCDPEIVALVVHEAPGRIAELIEWGTRFDKDFEGNYDYGLEGGHSQNRILHYKDITGLEIERSLLKKVNATSNIEIKTNQLAIDLIVNPINNTCKGAYILDLNSNTVQGYHASVTLLASGGLGQVYKQTTNPSIATGDGVAMAQRVGALIKNMEFIQFHPTALFHKAFKPSFLISEAVRGFGAILKNKNGEEFMQKYDERKELAPRDVVARAIHHEMIVTQAACVYLDATHLDKHEFRKHFPVISKTLEEVDIDFTKEWIPVTPAAHYSCGGIEVNQHAESSIQNLLACGECATTGLHGANRLASNSLLEALVFAHRASLQNKKLLENACSNVINHTFLQPENHHNIKIELQTIKEELQEMMQRHVSIIRSDKGLNQTIERLQFLQRSLEILYKTHPISVTLIETRNLVTVALLIANQSLKRKENKGTFYSESLV